MRERPLQLPPLLLGSVEKSPELLASGCSLCVYGAGKGMRHLLSVGSCQMDRVQILALSLLV